MFETLAPSHTPSVFVKKNRIEYTTLFDNKNYLTVKGNFHEFRGRQKEPQMYLA